MPAAPPSPSSGPPDREREIVLRINGTDRPVRVSTSTTLLDAIRDRLGLTGTKKGCDLGQCGACTVLLDGRRVVSCLALAVMQEGREITTIEGIAPDGEMHPVQAAFVEHDAFQCGYCTPGQIMSTIGLIGEGLPEDDAALRDAMSGNLCRCGAYVNIVAAIRDAAAKMGPA